MIKEKNSEKRLLIADAMLNVIHMRGDLSAMFVYGGKSSLDDLAGYVKQSTNEMLQREFVEGFDMEKFKSTKSFAERARYCGSALTRISSGSSRIIYKIDDKRVLKLAKNERGIAQNSVESDQMLNQWYGDIIAKRLEFDDDDKWIVSEYAKRVGPKRFEQLLGVTIDQLFAYLCELHPEKTKVQFIVNDKTREVLDVDNNEFMYDLNDMIGNWDMPIGDFSKLSTFGEINGKLVVTDYGLTKQVYDTHYNKKPQGRY